MLDPAVIGGFRVAFLHHIACRIRFDHKNSSLEAGTRVGSRVAVRLHDRSGALFRCSMNFTQICGRVSFAFSIDRQDGRTVIAVELVMRG